MRRALKICGQKICGRRFVVEDLLAIHLRLFLMIISSCLWTATQARISVEVLPFPAIETLTLKFVMSRMERKLPAARSPGKMLK